MSGHWIDSSLDKYVPTTDEPLLDLPDSPLEEVPTDGVESTRYDPLASTHLISTILVL
jgi:hypothetical protein